MQYFFIPGRISELSLAELKRVLPIYFDPNFYAIDATNTRFFTVRFSPKATEYKHESLEQLLSEVFSRLGGFLKYGEIIDPEEDFLEQYYDREKVVYGVSFYEGDSPKISAKEAKKSRKGVEVEDVDFSIPKLLSNMESRIKKTLTKAGVNSRYVNSSKFSLSTAQISQRSILEQGFELVLMQQKSKSAILTGKTIAIQDIEGFRERDYGRPSFDKKMGMLPPKLARMMVNFTGLAAGSTIWDPFCGSGTISVESLLLGYNTLASDIDPQSVENTTENINWIANSHDITGLEYGAFVYDVTEFSKRTLSDLRNTEIHGAVFEPYMGPAQRKPLHPKRADKYIKGVVDLYRPLFSTMEYMKSENLIVVAVIPSYKTHRGWVTTRYNEFLTKRWKVWFLDNKNPKLLHWERTNSIIRRDIIIAELKR